MWERLPLNDVLDFREGPGVLAKDFREWGVPLIRLAGLKGRSLLSGCNYLDPDAVAVRWSQFRLQLGDTLLSTSASLGEVATVDATGVGAVPYTGIIRFRPKNSQVHAEFIRLMLMEKSFKDQIEAMGVGSVMKHFGPSHLRRMTVTVPPIPEQRAIAEVLGALDDKIAANTALAATAREYAVTMLRIDAPTTPLGNVVIHHKNQANPANIDEPLVEHYSLPAFDGGGGPEVTSPRSIQSNKFRVDTPALLVSKLNPRTPRNWPVNGVGTPPRLASTEFLVLEPFVCDPWVMWALVSQPSFTLELESKVAGTSGSHQRVRPEEVLATPILDPRAIQPQLLADVRDVLTPIDALEAENRTLAATRDALLPQLMSGKLRVRDAERVVSEAGA